MELENNNSKSKFQNCNNSVYISGNNNVIGVPIKHYIELECEYSKLINRIIEMQEKITFLTIENKELKQKALSNNHCLAGKGSFVNVSDIKELDDDFDELLKIKVYE